MSETQQTIDDVYENATADERLAALEACNIALSRALHTDAEVGDS